MKKATLFLFILISVFTYAQDTTQTKTKKTKHFFVGVNFSPDLCSAILKKPVFDNIGLKAIPKYGFTSGINVCAVITKHISINFGVQYSKKETRVTSNLTFGDMVDRRRGFIYSSSSIRSFFASNTYNYLDFPLMANFIFAKKKTHFISSVGLTTNVLLDASDGFYIGGNNSRINISPTISCGIDYKVSNKAFFRIEPTLRYGLLKVSDGGFASVYLWNVGINLSWYIL